MFNVWNCKIKNKNIFANKFKKKGKYSIPCIAYTLDLCNMMF